MKIKISLTEDAQTIFHNAGIDASQYGPSAYKGESAGLDLFNMGPEVEIFGRNKWSVYGENPILVPTGVRIIIPPNHVGLILERGSIVRTGLSVRAGVIDPGFTGQVFVSFLNTGERDTNIQVGAKLPAQLVVVPCFSDFEQITYSEYNAQTLDAKRKGNMLGSTS